MSYFRIHFTDRLNNRNARRNGPGIKRGLGHHASRSNCHHACHEYLPRHEPTAGARLCPSPGSSVGDKRRDVEFGRPNARARANAEIGGAAPIAPPFLELTLFRDDEIKPSNVVAGTVVPLAKESKSKSTTWMTWLRRAAGKRAIRSVTYEASVEASGDSFSVSFETKPVPVTVPGRVSSTEWLGVECMGGNIFREMSMSPWTSPPRFSAGDRNPGVRTSTPTEIPEGVRVWRSYGAR